MEIMKTGFIVKILRQDNLGIIREESTLTEWLFFLDEASEILQIGNPVAFYIDGNEIEPNAENVKPVEPIQAKRVS